MAFTLATSAACARVSASAPRAAVRGRASTPRAHLGFRRSGSVSTRPARSTRRGAAVACAAGVDLRKLIERLCDGEDLTEKEAEESMDALLDADPAQISAFLVLLRAKGETGAEMAGLARAMKARGVPVFAGDDVLDIVGTGGDDAGTVNISTGSCILAAAGADLSLIHISEPTRPY